MQMFEKNETTLKRRQKPRFAMKSYREVLNERFSEDLEKNYSLHVNG